MNIQQLRLKNFRCFQDISLEFSPKFNIIIGDNSSGKSALLRGLCVSASSFFLGIDGVPNHPIQRNDIRLMHYEHSAEYQFPVEVECQGTIETEQLTWIRKRTGKRKETRLVNPQIKNIAQSLQKEVQDWE